jgi:phage terminase large subunit-like protein
MGTAAGRAAGLDWTVPILEVEGAIRQACRRWSVREIVCDPYRWGRTYQVLEEDGLPVVEFPQSPARMIPATTRFYEAVMNRTITHSGDPRLARHLANCVVRTDSRGSRLSKDAKHSPRKIDLAVSAVMALERACQDPAPEPEPQFFSWADL